jgi:CheY-like chemotaxis protein
LRDEESGTDVIEALRSEYNSQIPAILVTGDTAPERIREASESGLTLLHKPVSSVRLHKAIAEAVA